jgi:hypothetical protein
MVDGDTLKLSGQTVRLYGIDAPEQGQHCGGANAPVWACGAWTTAEVKARYDGRMMLCQIDGQDRYGRSLGRCQVDGDDLGAALVSAGLAFAYRAYSDAYVAAEDSARARRAGLHAAQVQSPEVFRDNQKRALAARYLLGAPAGCAIKGNVSHDNSEKIYHMPDQSSYGATRISASRGERWFCSETEARAAGWRRAKS